MAFENITKGNWSIEEDRIRINKHGSTIYPLQIEDGNNWFVDAVRVAELEPDRTNAEFIAFAFNLQQKLDISCYDEVIKLIGEIEAFFCFNNTPSKEDILGIKNQIQQVLIKAKL